MIEIYPGYKVSSDEYERRFKDVDLDYYRTVMQPNLFEAFVKTMGIIDGYGIELEDLFDGWR